MKRRPSSSESGINAWTAICSRQSLMLEGFDCFSAVLANRVPREIVRELGLDLTQN